MNIQESKNIKGGKRDEPTSKPPITIGRSSPKDQLQFGDVLGNLNIKFPDLNLEGKDLSGMDFNGMDLSNGNFRDANLDYANLKGCKLTNINLFNCSLFETKF